MKHVTYTAAVIGGGPAGSVVARVLAQAGVRVLLASARSPDIFHVGESLVPVARTILEALGLWERFCIDGHAPCYGNVSAWGHAQLVEADFIRSPYGHGWHLDRARFDAMLRYMAEAAGATVWHGTTLLQYTRQQSSWRLVLQTQEGWHEVTCAWLLDCTGRSRRIAAGLGIPRHYADRLLAFYARFTPDQSSAADEDSRTLVESVPQGWFHSALLPCGERVVTFFTDAGTPWLKQAKSQDGFLELLRETVHLARKLRTHGYTLCDRPQSTDARSSRLSRFHGEGWLAVGDAATTFDPLSSQGILSALYSGLKAGHGLVRHLNGDREALPQYDTAIAKVYDHFLHNRLQYYRYEQRWPHSPFWQARLLAVNHAVV